MTHHPFRSTLFIPVLYAVTMLTSSLWTGTAHATCSPQSPSQSVASGVTYYDCSAEDPAVHIVTIDTSLPGWRMHILAKPSTTTNMFTLRDVQTLALENDALVAINGYYWGGNPLYAGYCSPDPRDPQNIFNCPDHPWTGTPTNTLYMWGEQKTSFSGIEALMGFSGLQPKLFIKDSAGDPSAQNLSYRQTLYGSNRALLNQGVCKTDPDDAAHIYSAVGYSNSQIILMTTVNDYLPPALCGTFTNFGANNAVLNDGGPSGELYVGGNANLFIHPYAVLGSDVLREVAFAIGLVPVGAQGNTMQPGDVLIPGQSIFSSNGQYKFIYQYDGNLVLYRNSDGRALWASNTYGSPTRDAIMQTDGNLVVYDTSGDPQWASGTWGNSGARLRLLDGGNVIIDRPSDGAILWQTYTGPVVGAQGNTMNPNDVLIPGQSIFSSNGQYKLIYQSDGNLVLYRAADGFPLWASNTAGQTTRVTIMQTDGNLVVYNATNALWASGTWNNPNARLRLLDNGNMIIERPSDGAILWQTNTQQPVGNTMQANDVLLPGQSIFSSNGKYKLIYQSDGNLVLYRNSDGRALWASNTNGQATRITIMQSDGNLVVYDATKALWASGTWGNSGARLRLLDDGNMIIDRPSDGAILWQTNTAQPVSPPPSSTTCPTNGTLIPPYSYSGNKAHINLFTNAPARSDTDQSCPQVGQSYSSTNPQYIWCRRWGGEVRDSSGNYNHWWLWTDLDTGGSGWISAYYIAGQGNDQADDMNTGNAIEPCEFAPD